MTPAVIVGLTGSNASGKGEVSAYLERLGFHVHSLSDIIREEAKKQGFPPEREHLIRIGNALRAASGPGALAEMLLDRLGSRDVVDSIRNPAEVAVLRRNPQFRLLGIEAPIRVRFDRSLARARPGDPETLEAFEAREAQENSDNPGAQQLAATFDLADVVIDNHQDVAALHRAVDRFLASLDS